MVKTKCASKLSAKFQLWLIFMDEFLPPKKQMYNRSADVDTDLALKTCSGERDMEFCRKNLTKVAFDMIRNLLQK